MSLCPRCVRDSSVGKHLWYEPDDLNLIPRAHMVEKANIYMSSDCTQCAMSFTCSLSSKCKKKHFLKEFTDS